LDEQRQGTDMELALVKRHVEARPFTPFRLVLPSDRELEIPHPEFISISPQGVSAVVWYQDGGAEHVDLRLVVGLKTNGAQRG
jgi:hypothetical protein